MRFGSTAKVLAKCKLEVLQNLRVPGNAPLAGMDSLLLQNKSDMNRAKTIWGNKKVFSKLVLKAYLNNPRTLGEKKNWTNFFWPCSCLTFLAISCMAAAFYDMEAEAWSALSRSNDTVQLAVLLKPLSDAGTVEPTALARTYLVFEPDFRNLQAGNIF